MYIGVGGTEWSRSPLPPNRTGGSPASGSPVDGFASERIDGSEPERRGETAPARQGYRASLPTSLPLIGLLTRVLPRPCQSSWGHTLFFRPVPSANTLVRWVKENAFASIVQARPDPPWADRFIIGVAPIDYDPGLLLRPFGFHLAMDTLPSGVLPRNSTFFPLSGQRGITPAFGYGAPHPGARGTSTLLNNVLLSTHYGRSDSCPPDSWTLRFNACSPCGQASLIHASGLPAIPSPNTCGRSASSGRGTLPHQRVGPRAFPFGNSGLRRSLAGSPHLAGRIEFSFLPYRRDFLRTSRSPPVAPHHASRRDLALQRDRSYVRLRVTFTRTGLSPLRPNALSGAPGHG